ncbi:hypothetical protein [Fontibacter flavus]|uniref:Uncharacterized protein n=1 Tax=Fontibacter flavus TaxID=654838 RepID=A0ABV6FW13_9BACT
MARFLVMLFITALMVYLVGQFVPFWALMILTGLISFILGLNPGMAFFSAGIGFGLTWFLKSLMIAIQTGSDLPVQMAELMGIKNDNLLMFATFFLGFFIGGFSALTGSLFKRLFEKKYEGVYRKG